MKVFDIESRIRPSVRNLKPYSSARDEFQGDASVFLDANENPNDTGHNRYPDPHQVLLKKRIAEMKELKADQIFIGNGSDEAIDLLFRAFCVPAVDNVLIPQPTYGMYAISAAINDIAVRQVTLTAEFDLDADEIMHAWDAETRILFLCSPNNPTGNNLSRDRIEKLLAEFDGLVVVDEAYADFSDQPSLIGVLNRWPNLVILQTLSKAWGLAGIRVGMCFADPKIIQVLNKIKPPYNIGQLTQNLALSNLHFEERKNTEVREIRRQREELKANLLTLSEVEMVYPSDANFLLVKVKNAKKIYQTLVQKGIVVRDRSSVALCNDCLRITIGTAAENKRLLNELKQL